MPYLMFLDWVVERIKNFYHVVGLLCEGLEDHWLGLFIAVKASPHHNSLASVPNLCFKLADRGYHELKRFTCSMNYGSKGGHSHRAIGKGRSSNCGL